MAEIKIIKGHGLNYECPECGARVELGQNYCQDCGDPLNWKEDYDDWGGKDEEEQICQING